MRNICFEKLLKQQIMNVYLAPSRSSIGLGSYSLTYLLTHSLPPYVINPQIHFKWRLRSSWNLISRLEWPTRGDPNLGDLGYFILVVVINLGWSQFGSIWGDPNLDQLAMSPVWVTLCNLFGLSWSTWGHPILGQLGVSPIWVNLRWS